MESKINMIPLTFDLDLIMTTGGNDDDIESAILTHVIPILYISFS